jgi:hypothetical protein
MPMPYGRERFDFDARRITPLDFDALRAALEGEPIQTEMYGLMKDEAGEQSAHVLRATVNFKHPNPFYALVPGGVLPPAFFAQTDLRLSFALDRNVVSGLRQWHEKGTGGSGWSISIGMLNQPGMSSSPLLGAVEGSGQGAPSFERFCRDLDEIETISRTVLPRVNLRSTQRPGCRERMYAECVNLNRRAPAELEFLRQANLLLKNAVKAKALRAKEREILACAKALELQRGCFVVTTVLAKLYEATGGTDGAAPQGVLKFRERYGDADAYNALADIRQLEVIAGCWAGLPNPALITADQKLALLWAGLDVRSCRFNAQGVPDIQYRPRRLFQRLTDDECAALIQRLAG